MICSINIFFEKIKIKKLKQIVTVFRPSIWVLSCWYFVNTKLMQLWIFMKKKNSSYTGPHSCKILTLSLLPSTTISIINRATYNSFNTNLSSFEILSKSQTSFWRTSKSSNKEWKNERTSKQAWCLEARPQFILFQGTCFLKPSNQNYLWK